MGLFSNIFGKKQPPANTTQFQMINDTWNGFYEWGGNLYQSDIIRSCIRPKAKQIGKLTGKHIRNYNGLFNVNPDATIRFLLEEPNPLMTGQVFQEKMATLLELNNNAFAYIKRDDFGYAQEIYPIFCTTVEVVEGALGDIYLKFWFRAGRTMTVPYEDVIHLRKDFNEHDFFGDHPSRVLIPLMDVVSTTDQGITNAIKSSNVIKWILKFNSVLKKDDIRKNVNDFVNDYLNIGSNGGAAAADPRYDLVQVQPTSYVPNADQMDRTLKRLYNFFNTNENIIQSNYTEDQWNAWYESEIEPFAMQLAGEYTRKLFSRRERGYGNQIVFEASNLAYASMKTKMDLVAMVDRGAMTPNEWRQVMNLAPIEGGDDPIRRLDTAVVNNTDPSPTYLDPSLAADKLNTPAPASEGGDNGGQTGDPTNGTNGS